MPAQRSYDMSFLNRMSGGDKDFIHEMVKTFSEIAPEYIKKAKDLYNSQAIEALSKETHRMIPGVSFLGAKKLEKDLMLIEEYTKKKIQLDQISGLLDEVDRNISKLLDEFAQDFNL